MLRAELGGYGHRFRVKFSWKWGTEKVVSAIVPIENAFLKISRVNVSLNVQNECNNKPVSLQKLWSKFRFHLHETRYFR